MSNLTFAQHFVIEQLSLAVKLLLFLAPNYTSELVLVNQKSDSDFTGNRDDLLSLLLGLY